MSRAERVAEQRREARVVYAVTDPGQAEGLGPFQEPQTHYVSSLKQAQRMAEYFNGARSDREPTIVRIKVPKMTPKRSLLWALNFSDHAGSKHLSYGVSAYCDDVQVVDLIPSIVFMETGS